MTLKSFTRQQDATRTIAFASERLIVKEDRYSYLSFRNCRSNVRAMVRNNGGSIFPTCMRHILLVCFAMISGNPWVVVVDTAAFTTTATYGREFHRIAAPIVMQPFGWSTALHNQIDDKDRESTSATQQGDRLTQLGFTEEELHRSRRENREPPVSVNVNIVNDVDPVTLTAIGFALIAANFLIFANLGDGGIAGVVATIINLTRE